MTQKSSFKVEVRLTQFIKHDEFQADFTVLKIPVLVVGGQEIKGSFSRFLLSSQISFNNEVDPISLINKGKKARYTNIFPFLFRMLDGSVNYLLTFDGVLLKSDYQKKFTRYLRCKEEFSLKEVSKDA